MAPRKKPYHKLSRTAKFYRKSKKARDKKKETDKEVNKRPSQVRKRVEAKRARKNAIRRGIDVSDKDYDHKTGRMISSKKNRGKKGEGARKKKKKK